MRELLRTSGLKREQWEQLESNNCKKRATEKKCETDHRYYKHIPQKRRNGGMTSLKEGAM
jgi:hypothetical protein